jgi:hypothetical protein
VIADAGAANKALQRSKNKTTCESNNRKKFFSICWGLTELRARRFSPSADVVRFSGLIHPTLDQRSSLEARKAK